MTELEKVVKELARIREDHFGGMTSYEGEVLDAALALLKVQDDSTVIKCKDCDNWERDWIPTGLHPNEVEIHYCPYVDRYPSAEWFCADAERRCDPC